MDTETLEEICEELYQEQHITISGYARQLILLSIEAAQNDPNPDWEQSSRNRVSTLVNNPHELREQTKQELIQLAESLKSKKEFPYLPIPLKLSYFHILHWLHDNVKISGFPVKKDTTTRPQGGGTPAQY